MPVRIFLFRLRRNILLQKQKFRTIKTNSRCTEVFDFVCFRRDFDVRMQHDIFAVASHRFQLTHRKKFATLAFKNFLTFMELADIIFVRIDDNLAAGTIDDNRIAVLYESRYIAEAAYRRDLQRSRQNGNMACASTGIHHNGVHLSRLERHQEAWNKFMSHEDNAFFVSHVLQHRSGVVHRRHQAVVQVPKVCRLVPHCRGINRFEPVNVGAKHDMHRPLCILVVLLNLVEHSIDKTGILQNHQVGRKNQAVLQASSTFRDFLYLRNFFRRLRDGLQKHLFFCSQTALRERLFDYRKLAVCNREHSPHGKTRRGGHTNEFSPRRFAGCLVRFLRHGLSRVLR